MKYLETKALRGAPENKARAPRSAEPTFDATEGAEELAQEAGVDLAKVQGTGQDGRITKADVQAAIDAWQA